MEPPHDQSPRRRACRHCPACGDCYFTGSSRRSHSREEDFHAAELHHRRRRDDQIGQAHYFSGTSHAFGKYSSDDKTAGYWDAIIGPGKAIDTNKYFVLSSDTLVNLNVNAPNVVTTGPASIDPDTGKPYGMSFPVVGIKDFVRVEKALIDSLGITKLKA